MRNSIVLLTLITLMSFTSCKKDSPAQPLNDLLLSGGSWTISSYRLDSDPLDYAGYTLTFENDGKMHMQSNSKTGTGTWRTYDVDKALHLSIDVHDDDFINLEGSWMVLSMNSTRLELSAGFFVTYYMTLSKN